VWLERQHLSWSDSFSTQFLLIGNPDLESSLRFRMHSRCLILHVFVLLALWVVFWFIPDPFYNSYMKAAIYISGVYLLIQIFFLVDFMIQLNDKPHFQARPSGPAWRCQSEHH
jgi:hypothetical protein